MFHTVVWVLHQQGEGRSLPFEYQPVVPAALAGSGGGVGSRRLFHTAIGVGFAVSRFGYHGTRPSSTPVASMISATASS